MVKSDRNKQLSIFSPSLNPVSRLKAAMREAIRAGNQSREQLVDRMNTAARREGLGGGRSGKITVAMLDAWVAETKGNMIPLGLLPCFCWAAGSLEPLRVLAACLEVDILDAQDKKLLELAKIDAEARKLARRRRILSHEID